MGTPLRSTGYGHQRQLDIRKLDACLSTLNQARIELGYVSNDNPLAKLIDQAIEEAACQALAAEEHYRIAV
jgi:hypothetical protein